jgi:hypothetical protein
VLLVMGAAFATPTPRSWTQLRVVATPFLSPMPGGTVAGVSATF